jgi:hypothetical protein
MGWNADGSGNEAWKYLFPAAEARSGYLAVSFSTLLPRGSKIIEFEDLLTTLPDAGKSVFKPYEPTTLAEFIGAEQNEPEMRSIDPVDPVFVSKDMGEARVLTPPWAEEPVETPPWIEPPVETPPQIVPPPPAETSPPQIEAPPWIEPPPLVETPPQIVPPPVETSPPRIEAPPWIEPPAETPAQIVPPPETRAVPPPQIAPPPEARAVPPPQVEAPPPVAPEKKAPPPVSPRAAEVIAEGEEPKMAEFVSDPRANDIAFVKKPDQTQKQPAMPRSSPLGTSGGESLLSRILGVPDEQEFTRWNEPQKVFRLHGGRREFREVDKTTWYPCPEDDVLLSFMSATNESVQLGKFSEESVNLALASLKLGFARVQRQQGLYLIHSDNATSLQISEGLFPELAEANALYLNIIAKF